jgi:hypothetical protein
MNLGGHVWAFALTALCVVAAVILVLDNKAVPVELWQLAFAAGGAGAALALPTTRGGTPP